MTIQRVERADWSAFFERLSRALEGARAEIDAMSLSFGGQIEADWRPILGLAYDPKDDLVEVALEGLDHLVERPRDIFFDEAAGMLGSLEIVDGNDVKHIVRFKEPLMLPLKTAPK